MKNVSIDRIKYSCFPIRKASKDEKSIHTIGIDTEAYPSGRCFMIATSFGDVFKPRDLPAAFFTRKYRGSNFVVFNLKYDAGAIIQSLPKARIRELWETDSTEHNGYVFKVIANKCLSIRKGKNTVHFYDMYTFYQSSLNLAAKRYLGKEKIDLDPKLFTYNYVRSHWEEIANYCILDSDLVNQLTERLINHLESYGVFPRKLYSVAYISFQYFSTHTPYVTVKKYWDKHKEVLDYAIRSYNGGKFEVTSKGISEYWEYDLVSAYPSEIANLIDISWSRVTTEAEYIKSAVYSFLDVSFNVPEWLPNPCVVKRRAVNCYPIGRIRKVLTKTEYEYFETHGVSLHVHSAIHLRSDNRQYPYRKEIKRLTRLKQQYKRDGKDFDYHIVKVLMNSLYGKFVQLIEKEDYLKASTCWNPIYAAVITANIRVRISEYQFQHPSVVAVHTDSLISTKPLPYEKSNKLGELSFEEKGYGLILGSGIYQIGNKVRFRGFPLNISLFDLLEKDLKRVSVFPVHSYTWREVAFKNWPTEMINRFEQIEKKIDINFDKKRIWLKDWKKFSEVPKHRVDSVPLFTNEAVIE